jgi:hypothetical protein
LQQGGDGRRKAADGAPADHQPADDLVLAQQRHRQNGMDALQQSTDDLGDHRRILLHVLDMHRRAQHSGAAEMGLAYPDPPLAQPFDPLGAHAKGGFRHKDFFGLVEFVDRAFIGLRELGRAADDRGQHGVEVERGIHRAQHFLERLQFGDRAGQRVGTLAQFAISLGAGDGDGSLLGEGLQQCDLAVGEAADLRTRQHHRADRRGNAICDL